MMIVKSDDLFMLAKNNLERDKLITKAANYLCQKLSHLLDAELINLELKEDIDILAVWSQSLATSAAASVLALSEMSSDKKQVIDAMSEFVIETFNETLTTIKGQQLVFDSIKLKTKIRRTVSL